MLVYESTDQLLAEPPARRYLHTILLTALRDKAERVEVRFMEGEGTLYYRVNGRDWELTPPPDELYPLLKDTLREAAKLVQPDRPDTTILFGVPDARFEPMEVGWLTYQLGGYWVDVVVRIDPREPFGYIRLDIDDPEDFADAAGDALEAYAATLGAGTESDEPSGE